MRKNVVIVSLFLTTGLCLSCRIPLNNEDQIDAFQPEQMSQAQTLNGEDENGQCLATVTVSSEDSTQSEKIELNSATPKSCLTSILALEKTLCQRTHFEGQLNGTYRWKAHGASSSQDGNLPVGGSCRKMKAVIHETGKE